MMPHYRVRSIQERISNSDGLFNTGLTHSTLEINLFDELPALDDNNELKRAIKKSSVSVFISFFIYFRDAKTIEKKDEVWLC